MNTELLDARSYTGNDRSTRVVAATPRLSSRDLEQVRRKAYLAVTESRWAEAGRLLTSLGNDPRLTMQDLAALATIRLRFEEYEAAWQVAARMLEIDPSSFKAAQLGTLALAAQNRWAEALPLFERHASGAARQDRVFVASHGAALVLLGRPEQALPVLLEGVLLDPADPGVHIKLALALRDLKMFEEAAESFQTALTLDPKRLAARLMVLHMRQHACNWNGFEPTRRDILEALADPAGLAGSLNEGGVFTLVGIEHPPELFLKATASVAMQFAQVDTPLPRRRVVLEPARRLRVGYVSNDFHNHATAALLVESLECRDRQQFEVTLYSHSKDDGSELQHRIRAACDRFVDISRFDDAAAARRIHADGIDLLVDLKGHTLGNRLGIFAWRPAPVQASFLGFPGSSGAGYIDYIVGDRWVTPLQHADRYCEAIAQMPGCYQPNDSRRVRPPAISRAEAGLPERAFVLGCFNQAFKITPQIFEVWMRILHALPQAVLWLLEDNRQATANLRRAAAAHGICDQRLIFAPRLSSERNLARLPLADLMLDNWPCNAHTTAGDILWMGVPLITVQGEAFASRVAASLLAAVGLEQLVCRDAARYEALVLELARQPARLAAFREHLEQVRCKSSLFDGASHARALENLYLRMLTRASQGLAPAALAFDRPAATDSIHLLPQNSP